MSPEQISNLEYREDVVYNKFQKSAKAIYVKEMPYAGVEKQATVATIKPDGTQMTEKERMIAELKARLLAPAPIP